MPATEPFLSQHVVYNYQGPAFQHLDSQRKRRTENPKEVGLLWGMPGTVLLGQGEGRGG